MYFHYRLFLRALYLALIKSPFSLRRWMHVFLFMVLFWIMWLVVAIGRGLDHILYPGFRKQKVEAPLFIIAPPRSGTTFTQKLLSIDDSRFVHAKLYQTILPSITYHRLIERGQRLDKILGSPFERLLHWAERKFFGGWDGLHTLRLNAPEEDDGFFVYTFVTEAVFLLFPFVDELWEAGFADALPVKEQKKLMRYYRGCLQRQLYAHGPGKTILSKATQSSGALECLLHAFPDARFVTIVRNPCESVASHVSLFHPVWKAHSPEIQKDSPTSHSYARLAVEWFRHLYDMREKFPQAHYWCIDFRDLTKSPMETIEKMYAHFGYDLNSDYRIALNVATAKNSEYRSKHEYTLEEFGLSKEYIHRELGDLFDTYALER